LTGWWKIKFGGKHILMMISAEVSFIQDIWRKGYPVSISQIGQVEGAVWEASKKPGGVGAFQISAIAPLVAQNLHYGYNL
jgi:hypothetical protein